MPDLFKLDLAAEAQMMDWYRHFHQFPELSMQEFMTTDKIKEILTGMGVGILPLDTEVGVVAAIDGVSPGPEVVLRADIDALPIQEESGLAFQSTVRGVSHMCGHDFHTSVLLGTAHYLREHRDQLKGRVKLIFQPGEETTAGAKYLLEKGALTGAEKVIFGLHNAPQLPAGTVGIHAGPFFAAADTLHIQVFGRKGHAAMPHLTIDATVAASAVVMGLQSAVSRNVNPLDPAVVTIGSLHSGQGHNVISDHAEMWGTIRTFSKETRQLMYEIIPRIATQVAEGYGARVQVDILPQTPAVNNDPAVTERFRQAALRVLSEDRILQVEPIMAAEDFAVYQERIPGCYFLMGTGDTDKQVIEAWHHPKFRANENMLPIAAALLIQAVLLELE